MFKYLSVGLFLFSGLSASVFCIIPNQNAFAASKCDGVIISEIMPNPNGSYRSEEWVELKNVTENEINLSGCKIKDHVDPSNRPEYAFSEEAKISAKGFLLLYNLDTKIILNDSEDGMDFLSERNVISTVSYKGASNRKGQSYALNGSAWEWTTDVTPGFEKSTSGTGTPVDGGSGNTCEGLIVSELMPDPVSPLTDTNDEWIEIYNESGDPVNAGGCILTDTQKTGSTHEYKISGGVIAPSGFMVFYSKNTKISLNNSDGDSVRILSPDKKVIFETQNYGKAQAGQSWAYDGDKWFWTVAPTAGALNVIEIADESSATKASSKKTASSKSTKSSTTKAKAKTSPLAKSSSAKTKSAGGAEVLGASTDAGGTGDGQGKISDKMMGYMLVTLAGALLIGYLVYINKDFIYENSIKRFRRDS